MDDEKLDRLNDLFHPADLPALDDPEVLERLRRQTDEVRPVNRPRSEDR